MNDIIVLAGVSLASATVGGVIVAACYVPLVKSLRANFAALRNSYEEIAELTVTLGDRIDAAMRVIPPYKRGVNGTVQKIGRILRGEQ